MPKSIYRPEYTVVRELIREFRTARGITQDVLSERLGRNQSFLSDVERGVRRIDVLELRDLCEQIGIDLPRFITELERRLAPQRGAPSIRVRKKKPSTPR